MRGLVVPAGDRPSNEVDQWQAGMAVRARTVAPALVDASLAAVPDARRVLDLGGGHGEYGLEFARRGLQVVLQDRPTMLAFPRRREVWAAGGVELFPADFFDALPEGPFDIVWLAGVTHTFDGEHNRRLYRSLRPLVAPGGAVVIVTFLRGTPRARVFAVQMLVVGNRGDTHAEEEYREWLGEAGFGMELVDVDQLGQQVIVARPV
jgi:SAM-dependent methyltransferase